MTLTATRHIPSGLSPSGVTIEGAALSYLRNCKARNLTRDTIAIYEWELRRLHSWLTEQGMPTDVGLVSRDHIEAYIVGLQDRLKPASISMTFRSLRTFFTWVVSEDERPTSPMAKMRAPIVPVDPPAIMRREEMEALLNAVKGKTFEERRDRALFMFMYDTGVRRGELVAMDVTDVDLRLMVASVRGKARVFRPVAFGDEVADALDRYLRARRSHPHAADPALWIGTKGRLGGNGVLLMMERRGALAGIKCHPHTFRHSWANAMLAAGAGEGDVLALGGWKSRDMLDRYGAVARSERAIATHRRVSPADALRRGTGR